MDDSVDSNNQHLSGTPQYEENNYELIQCFRKNKTSFYRIPTASREQK
jgi:hypothetical protein